MSDHLEVTGVSRCGRVRKKSSKLVDFTDDIEAMKTLKRVSQKSPSIKPLNTSQRSSAICGNNSKSTIKSYFHPISKSHNRPHPIVTKNNAIPRPMSNILNSDRADIKKFDSEENTTELSSPSKCLFDYEHVVNIDNNNDIDSDEDYEMTIDTTMRKSAYMSEKSSKKRVFKDGEIVLSRPQRKDKGKPRFTAYMLWSKEIRQEMLKSNPNMDFSQASRRLSSMWAIVPNNEKNIWRRRAKRVTIKNKRALKTGEKLSIKYLNKQAQKKSGRKSKNIKATVEDAVTSPLKRVKVERRTNALNRAENDDSSKQKVVANSSNSLCTILPGAYKITGTAPSDVAAHLKLLGDNLAIIGSRLKEHEVTEIIQFLNLYATTSCYIPNQCSAFFLVHAKMSYQI